jgi:hypothetical protein
MTKDVIVDAEWDEIPDRDSGVNANASNTASRPPNEQPRSKSSDAADAITPLTQSRTMVVLRKLILYCGIAVAAVLIFDLLARLWFQALYQVPAHAVTPSPSPSSVASTRATASAALPLVTAPAVSDTPKKLINGCYHLESCTYWQPLDTEVLREGRNWRLVQANLRPGSVSEPSGNSADESRIVWDRNKERAVVALCSTTSPTLAWPSGSKYLAEEFDFGGNGVDGVQQDDANIYQALCHGFYNNELTERAAALGYVALPDGGRNQFEVDSVDALVTSN